MSAKLEFEMKQAMGRKMKQRFCRHNNRASAGVSTLHAVMRKFALDRSGAIIVIFALCLPILIGAAGLVADVGFWYLEKRRLQEAADTGAVAAASEFSKSDQSDDQTLLNNAAAAAINKTAYDDAAVDVNNPPESGFFTTGDGYSQSDGFIEVVITRPYTPYFAAILGLDSINISARAVAKIGNIILSDGTNCILALGGDGYANPAIYANGGPELHLAGCGLHANGDPGEECVDIGQNVSIAAGCITATCEMSSKTENNYVEGTLPDPYDPDIHKGIYTECGQPEDNNGDHVYDPFEHLRYDDTIKDIACDEAFNVVAWNLPGENGFFRRLIDFASIFSPIGKARADHLTDGEEGAITVQPGSYCNLGAISDKLILEPGVYFLQGDTTFNGDLQGENVIFIMIGDGAEISTHADAQIHLKAPTPEYLAAPGNIDTNYFEYLTDAPSWRGMLIHNATEDGNNCNTINGSSATSFVGALYFPHSCVKINGNSDVAPNEGCMMLIADNIKVTGTTAMSNEGCETIFDSEFGVLKTETAGLVE